MNFGEGIDGDYIRKNAKVWLTDGKSFGGEGYVRINFGCPRGCITEALDRIESALAAEKERKYG